jgi:fumarylacetoacetate (FAA) hydrolase family protein
MTAATSATPWEATLPEDGCAGTLLGRVWDPEAGGPSPVVIRDNGVFDLSSQFATVSGILESDSPAEAVRTAAATAPRIASFQDVVQTTFDAPEQQMRLLSPIDLQTIKAAGVTFAVSTLERVIEERAKGDPGQAEAIRGQMAEEIGADISKVIPGSEAASALKASLIRQGLWSQYLEVGIGPDAEIFTKGPVLSSVGTFSKVGVLAKSEWNNPEPEVVLIVDSNGRAVGATLGNDVNLRDIEGRSALLLAKAKDNNASCAIGPVIRLFDSTFGIDDVRALAVELTIHGDDGFELHARSEMNMISRDPLELIGQLVGPHHQYPDGAALMLGTMFAPVVDRDEPGRGFTHKRGDIVRISSPLLGSLVNKVEVSEQCDPWVFGVHALMQNLAARELL